MFSSPWRGAVAVLIASFLIYGRAQAELGGPAATIAADGERLKARIASTAIGSYTRHELTRANTGVVREFSNGKGQVFAVTWSGPGKPDLRTLLGPYFTVLQADGGVTGRAMHSLRRPAQVDQGNLRIQTGGHMGWFHGVAFIPSLAPADFAPRDLAREP